jgi:hypothetical protein
MAHRCVRLLVVLMVLLALAVPALAGEHECLPVTVCFTPGGELHWPHRPNPDERQTHDFGASRQFYLGADRQSPARRP